MIDPAWKTLNAASARELIEAKFDPAEVRGKLGEHGFHEGSYRKVLVYWSWDEGAAQVARAQGVSLWSLPRILQEIASFVRGRTLAFPDDILRTFQLLNAAGLVTAHEEAEG